MPKRHKSKKKNFKTGVVIFLLVLLSMFGVGVMLYPQFAARYSEAVRSEIQTNYEEEIQEIDDAGLEDIRASAVAYNQRLFDGTISPLEPEKNRYYDELSLSRTQIMCYVSIPKIGVYLPVYHGIGDDALSAGAGHMPQSSLPVGGQNTHTVISAHSGMAQSPMFSDLELLEIGDYFQIIVLKETLTYEVDNIQIVLPEMVGVVQIQRDKDLASLITCTPYGVNTHRLVVTGHRVEPPTEEETEEETTVIYTENQDSVWTAQYWKSMKIGAGFAFGFIIISVLVSVVLRLKQKRKGGKHE